ncbi:MAG: hypothetical protein IKR04_07445 [Clostridia bacterium]|nr:hypothetical protein [Clostridia bacterium]
MDYKVEWRVTYKRSMADRWLRGYSEKDAFKFFSDDELCPDFAAFLEYKLLPGSSWTIFCRIFMDRSKTNFFLIDADGNKIVKDGTYLTKNIFTIFLKKHNPTPRQFLSVINAKEYYYQFYKV